MVMPHKDERVRTTRLPDDDLPIGTPVLAFGGTRDDRVVVTRTRSEVWQISGQPVVAVEGIAGGIALTHIEVLPSCSTPGEDGP